MGVTQKLELTWIGKDNRPRLEPRILLEDPELSYAAKKKVGENNIFDNILIQGDNLLALKALEQEFSGKIKIVYIDPPYNTGSAFESYDDGVAHSLWLGLMRERLEILWRLLTPNNGTLFISINDDEAHYLKVLCDEVCGRRCFVASLVWNYEGNTDNQAKIIRYHEYILVYSTTGTVDNPRVIAPTVAEGSKLHRAEIRNTIIKNGPKNPPKTIIIPKGMPTSFEEGVVKAGDVQFPQYSSNIHVKGYKTLNEVQATTGWSSREIFEEFIQNNFRPVKDSKGQETVLELRPTGAIEAVKVRGQEKGHFVSVLRGLGTTNQMRILLDKLGVKFTYPKPVNLISYLISAFSGEDDYILDSFAGSGTTGHAVMQANLEHGGNRKFILIELNAQTVEEVTLPRLRAVVDGHEGAELPPHGGGFRFYRLAPSLLAKDPWGNYIISDTYRRGPDAGARLTEAMCKLEGFRYAPSLTIFWQNGRSSETDYIYVTTQTLSHEKLQVISAEVGPEQSLLICCAAFKANPDDFPNITLKKIPSAVLARCEWGKDDYSLNVRNVMGEEPDAPTDPTEVSTSGTTVANSAPKRGRPKKVPNVQELSLFAPRGDK